MKTIVIEVDPQGAVKLEGKGFVGKACDEKMAAFEKELGTVTDRKNSPEYSKTVTTLLRRGPRQAGNRGVDEEAGANLMSKKKKGVIPVCEVKCASCPFREGSKTAFLALHLAESALTQASRICHSTGSNNAFHRRTGKPEMICRGSRDVQIQYFYSIGFIAEPTDEAWTAKLNAAPPAKSRRGTGDATAFSTGKS